MADYCTTAEAKALATVESGLASSTDYDPVFAVFVTAASRLIDREVGRWDNYFDSADTSDSLGTYYYDGSGTDELWIDEFASVSTVAVSEEGGLASSDYTAWSSSDYITYPYNSTPVFKLEVDTINGSKIYFDRYRKSVRITGIRGYSETPPAVVNLAARIQSSIWFAEGKRLWQNQGANNEFGGVNVNIGSVADIDMSTLHPKVAKMLIPYKVANL